MGVVTNIDLDKFPKQGIFVGRRVTVCFNYDYNHVIQGIVLRQDVEEPLETIIGLVDGRVVRSTECQWTLTSEGFKELSGQPEDLYRRLTANRLQVFEEAVTQAQRGVTKALLFMHMHSTVECTPEELQSYINRVPIEMWANTETSTSKEPKHRGHSTFE